MDNTFMQEKLLPQLTFNPGLALTGFRTTWPRSINTHQKSWGLKCGSLTFHIGKLRNNARNRFMFRQRYEILRSVSLGYESLDMLQQGGGGEGGQTIREG